MNSTKNLKRLHEEESSTECQPNKKSKTVPMKEIVKNPGLQYIIEKIFLNLDFEDILACKLINKSCKTIVDNPTFWLKKWRLRGLSKENRKDWIKLIQMNTNANVEKYVDLYIKKIIRDNYHVVDVPCYIDKVVVERFSKFVDDNDGRMNYSIENAFWEAVRRT